MRRIWSLLAGAVLLPAAAMAQGNGPPNPFTYTCGDFLAAQSEEERYVADLMVYWIVGYMHGRFAGETRLTLDQAHHDGSVTDILNALKKYCPNIPTMPLATFTQNLAGDLQKSLQ